MGAKGGSSRGGEGGGEGEGEGEGVGGGCSLWCDGEERSWGEGASTVIDTTFWHETRNSHPTEPVFVLLIDFWHPSLTPREVIAMQTFLDLEAQYIADTRRRESNYGRDAAVDADGGVVGSRSSSNISSSSGDAAPPPPSLRTTTTTTTAPTAGGGGAFR